MGTLSKLSKKLQAHFHMIYIYANYNILFFKVSWKQSVTVLQLKRQLHYEYTNLGTSYVI